jgi:hypothetical protein
MTSPTEPPGPAAQPQMLSYRPPAEEVGRVSPPIVCATSIGIAILVFGSVFVSLLLTFGVTGSGVPLLIIPAVLMGLIVAAVRLRRGNRGRSVAMGIWIGMGIALLAEGLCWGIGAG